MVSRIQKILGNPRESYFSLRAKTDKEGLFRRYAELSRRNGFTKLYFVLSLDCDTDEDIDAASELHKRLADIGVSPSYAVSGHVLQKGADMFGGLASSGAEFINHGFTPHTYFDTEKGRYASCFFYHAMPLSAVSEDIQRGDALLRETIGAAPSGFRVPHFGTFQSPQQLVFLHGELKKLGYAFSSSTMPLHGFMNGGVYLEDGVAEFPVSGMWSKPLSVLDSWEFLRAPGRTYTENDYEAEGKSVAEFFEGNNLCGVLNYYADPSHVAGNETFFKTVEAWNRIARNISYRALLDELALNRPVKNR